MGSAGRSNDRDLATNEVGRLRRQSLVSTFRPTILDRHVLAFYVADFLQSWAKRGCVGCIPLRRCAVEEPDHRHCRLLRWGRQWPNSCANEQRYELPSLHSMTSSARARSVAGTVMPSALAVFILMTSWKRVGCSTGKSAGWAALRILST